ncbi:MAG TPA: hypothetical protein VF479_08740 [Pseudolysinimonas sp.]
MARGKQHRYVLRDTGPTVVFWLAVVVGAILVADPIWRRDLGSLAATAPFVALVLWFLGLVLFHPHVSYDDERVVLTNIGRVHEVPWSRVVAVRQNIALRFELDDGRSLRAVGVTAPRDRGVMLSGLSRGKFGAGAVHYHQHADALTPLIGSATSNDTQVRSHWDVVPLAIGAALTLVVVIDLLVMLK